MHIPKHVLVTGGAGFIGSNFVRFLLGAGNAARVINADAMTYAGHPGNLEGLEAGARYRFVQGDITDAALVARIFKEEQIDTVVHLAAESHVDRSIEDPLRFVSTNVTGTVVLLRAAQAAWGSRADVRFHHVSTDEVFGSLGASGAFTEQTAYDPSSPYSASKAASDHFVRAWGRTYGLPVTISNCSNNYGPRQFPEKVLPLMITHALAGKPLPVYGDGKHVRDWLYVEDHCRAIDLVVRRGRVGETYTIGGNSEWANLHIVQQLCDLLMDIRPRSSGHYRELITFVADRPGHDRRYAIDTSKIKRDLGWAPQETFASGLRKTVCWYLDNPQWIDAAAKRYGGERLGLTAGRGA